MTIYTGVQNLTYQSISLEILVFFDEIFENLKNRINVYIFRNLCGF